MNFTGTDEEFEWSKLKEYQLIYWGQLGSRLSLMFESKMDDFLSNCVKPEMLTADDLEFYPNYELNIKRHSKNWDPDGLTYKHQVE